MKENTDENAALRVKVDPGDKDAESSCLCYQQQEVNKTISGKDVNGQMPHAPVETKEHAC